MMSPNTNANDTAASETQRLMIISAAVDGALGVGKVAVGAAVNSSSLVADGIHSMSDLATDLMVWIMNRIGAKGPDENHPYGHARFETLGTLVLSGILIAVAGGLIYDNAMRMIDYENARVPGWQALLVAAISIGANEWLYHITRRLGLRLRSNLLVSNAWHHRTDSLSSVVVFIGVAGALIGFVWLELLAAIAVAVMIANVGWTLGRQSIEELVDTAQSDAYIAEIRSHLHDIDGVRDVHSIRTRRMGPDVIVELHLQVEPAVSVSEGHHIGLWATKTLMGAFDDINDVIVHIDVDDDQLIEADVEALPIPPLRKEVKAALMASWETLLAPEDIKKITLHYLRNGVDVELFLAREYQERVSPTFDIELMQAAAALPWLRRVSVWYD